MKRWRFALERRWFAYLALAVVFAIACFFLSRWQFGRNNETVAASTLLNRNYSAPAVPLTQLITSKSDFSATNSWRKVEMNGEYEPSKQLLVRDRTMGSDPGFEVLTPFKLADGRTFIVDRGWLPLGEKQELPDSIPAPPKGKVQLTARLQASETLLPGRVAPSGQISEINLPKFEQLTGVSAYTGAYGLLASETPKPPERPVPAPRPVIDNGPFLSYAFQWILFAILGFVGLGLALRQEYRIRNSEDPVEQARAAERERKAALKPLTDAQIEDAQIARAEQAETTATTAESDSDDPGPSSAEAYWSDRHNSLLDRR
jgi:cytochrome oxidase assembly protein ShyY1